MCFFFTKKPEKTYAYTWYNMEEELSVEPEANICAREIARDSQMFVMRMRYCHVGT